jgi:hypothetical protein
MSRPKKASAVDLSSVKTYSYFDRANRTEIGSFGRPVKGADGDDFFDSLPRFLKALDLNEFISLVVEARKQDLPFHMMLGAHTIKVGLSPIFIELMQKGIVTGLSFNCAGVIHDLELALWGGTSEDVQAGLQDGSFGMVEETAAAFADVCNLAANHSIGLGEACGRYIDERNAENRALSMFAIAHELELPVTVHAGIGTDIVAQHPTYNAARVATASHIDFRILAGICRPLDRGGVIANVGSAVILPEVFLKALTVARNISGSSGQLTTANFDMISHYRPMVNVVTRPTFKAGKGFNFVGHHEIMIPLLAWGLKKKFDN